MLAKSVSLAIAGIDAQMVVVEVDIVKGLPGFTIVGLPDSTVKESRERIRSAVENSGFVFPSYNYVVNLAPASLKKQGANYDLPVALAILNATGQIALPEDPFPAVGELSLEGDIRPVRGVLSMVLALHRAGYERILVPYDNRIEAASAETVGVYPARNLREAVSIIENGVPNYIFEGDRTVGEELSVDFAHIYGQESVKRAVEIAVAGKHNILLYGPPGSGKTMIARAVPSIMPQLSRDESIMTTMIHSVSGLLPESSGLCRTPPFRTPHHTASDIALVGGGKIPGAGEVSLAHNGVLFMDEFSEFKSNVLQSLRQPLEDKVVTVSRASGSATFPSDFLLIAATNPCPCGYLFDPEKQCRCSQNLVAAYFRKIAGPVLDRIDMEMYVPRIPYRELMSDSHHESSREVRARVEVARGAQSQRFNNRPGGFNARMTSREVKQFCSVDRSTREYFEHAAEALGFSARSYFRILKVARTIADLAGNKEIGRSEIAEALSYKSLNRLYGA